MDIERILNTSIDVSGLAIPEKDLTAFAGGNIPKPIGMHTRVSPSLHVPTHNAIGYLCVIDKNIKALQDIREKVRHLITAELL